MQAGLRFPEKFKFKPGRTWTPPYIMRNQGDFQRWLDLKILALSLVICLNLCSAYVQQRLVIQLLSLSTIMSKDVPQRLYEQKALWTGGDISQTHRKLSSENC